MSETLTHSMYSSYPFKRRSRFDRIWAITRKTERARRYLKNLWFRREYARNSIADVKIKIGSIKRFRHEYFPDAGPMPWLDRPNALEAIGEKLKAGKITQQQAELLRTWNRDGYVILERVIPADLLDRVWTTYQNRIYRGDVPVEIGQRNSGDLYFGRCLDPHKWVKELKQVSRFPALVDFISLLMGVRAIPFQTIMGFAGSEQLAHSDSIHMTSYPKGYLAAAWVAFEDIHPDSGPLFYYPGSHKLPYILSKECDPREKVDLSFKRHGAWYSEYYEPAIAKQIKDSGLPIQYFNPKKGDVLIWHANLIHGGSPRKNRALSRKAMVGHYFGEGAFCYGDRHEMPVDIYQG